MKVMSLERLNRSKKLKSLVQTEIAVMRECNSPNVTKYIDSFEASEFLFIVMEYCNGGTL